MNLLKTHDYSLAVVAILYSSTLWGLVWYPMRLLEKAGINVVWTTFTVYLASALLASVQLWRYRKRIESWPTTLWLLGLAAGCANIAFLEALIDGNVMRVMLLFYLSPLWSVLLSRWWLGERISQCSMLMIVLAMSGTLLMLWHPDIGLPWPYDRADWLALFASVMFSVNNVLSRQVAAVPMQVKTTVVYWGVVLVSAVVLIFQRDVFPDIGPDLWLAVFIFGGLCFTSMTVAVLYGLAHMPVFRSAVLMLFELLVAGISAWWLTSEGMTVLEIIGGVMIALAAYGIARAGRG